MQDRGSPILETERLILREFREEDWRDVQEYRSDPAVVKYLPFLPATVEETKDLIAKIIGFQKAQPRTIYNFAIVDKHDDKVIGSCSIELSSDGDKQGEIGYMLNRSYWNRGLTTEAARRVISFGFERLGLHRIYGGCDPANTASSHVMEKLGMQKEGHLREHEFWKGAWRDFLLYATLEQEWNKNNQASRINTQA
jgi:[ribosomal protein S5]-alanine N-acetyltransferase